MELKLREVLRDCDEEGLRICSWKNNHKLEEIFQNKKDLDLYVPLEQRNEFRRVLAENGFIEGWSKLSDHPFVSHYYYPGSNKRLVHIHVYYRFVTGESHLKDFCLPIEDLVISARVHMADGIYVPAPEVQRLIFLLRHYLKNSSILGILTYRRERSDYCNEFSSIKCEAIGSELEKLFNQKLLHKLDSRLEQSELVDTWLMGRQLRKVLRPFRIYPSYTAFCSRYSIIVRRLLNKLVSKRKKHLVGGGRFVAITGLDGSGKSSIIDTITSYLARDFTVLKVHLGRPPTTIQTLPVRLGLAVRKKIQKSGTSFAARGENSGSLIFAIRYASLAYERMKLSHKILMRINRGEIVISDRFPSQSFGKMDSPRIDLNSNKLVIRKLARFERNCYKAILRPDLLIELQVPLDVAIERNQERDKSDKETPDEIKQRYRDNFGLKYDVRNHLVFKNDIPKDEAESKIMKLIWPYFQ